MAVQISRERPGAGGRAGIAAKARIRACPYLSWPSWPQGASPQPWWCWMQSQWREVLSGRPSGRAPWSPGRLWWLKQRCAAAVPVAA